MNLEGERTLAVMLWGCGAFQAEGTVSAKVGAYLLPVEQGAYVGELHNIH